MFAITEDCSQPFMVCRPDGQSVRDYPPWRPLEGSAKVSFEFPYSALKAGLNNVKISQKQAAPAKVRWVEIDITP